MKQHQYIVLLLVSLASCLALPACAPHDPAAGPDTALQAADPRTMQLLQAELSRVLAARGIELDAEGQPLKSVSAIPKLVYGQPGWFNDFNGDTSIAWIHYQVGDYDQNGEVNISDLTPVGIHFGKNTGSPDWLTAALIADGDGNGEINIADVTPIGQNFGARVAGYMVQAREATGEWREVGFCPMESGVKSGPALEMGFFVNGGAVEADFRVAPVAGQRDFQWNSYQLTTADRTHTRVKLAQVDGRPAVCFQSYDASQANFEGFAIAAIPHPASATDWFVEDDLGLPVTDDGVLALASVSARPVLAFVDMSAAPASYGVGYSRRDNAETGPSAWTTHTLASLPNHPGKLGLVVREGRPAIILNNFGLELYQAQLASPSGPADWASMGASPQFTDVREVYSIASGPWLFSVAGVVTPGNNIIFNRSTVQAPSGSGSFSEYLLAPMEWGFEPRMILIAGLPCIAGVDTATQTVQFLQAANRTVDSAGFWFQHAAVSTPGTNDSWEPDLQLVAGRPAIACGYEALDFHWTGGQFPDDTANWDSQPAVPVCVAFGCSLLSMDGLPLIAYLVEDGAFRTQVNIAVAVEK